MTVDSGATLMKAQTAQRCVFTRDAAGKTELQIDGNSVGTGSAPGPIVNVRALGFRVGMGMDGRTFPFAGTVTDLSIRQGVVTEAFFKQSQQEAQRLEGIVRQAGAIKKIAVRLLPDESHARLQHVKDIMNAAGVTTLSDLDTLPVRQRTPLARGQVLLAPRKTTNVRVNWGQVAQQLRAGDVTARRTLLATNLTNQNSAQFLSRVPTATIAPVRPVRPTSPISPILTRAMPAGSRVRITELQTETAEMIKVTSNQVSAIDVGLLDRINGADPSRWLTTAVPVAQVMELQTIPIDSAVVIAGTLDLTEQQLVVEPNVLKCAGPSSHRSYWVPCSATEDNACGCVCIR